MNKSYHTVVIGGENWAALERLLQGGRHRLCAHFSPRREGNESASAKTSPDEICYHEPDVSHNLEYRSILKSFRWLGFPVVNWPAIFGTMR
ncbi:hypothetical protein [Methylomonas koyamae]|uniref:hypothetical protein n=1 Tax=Methylomonas koyamae TaxID=702114 RepID=UPI001127DE13|nr:hypothetical protein [Methylomonas koyamae]